MARATASGAKDGTERQRPSSTCQRAPGPARATADPRGCSTISTAEVARDHLRERRVTIHRGVVRSTAERSRHSAPVSRLRAAYRMGAPPSATWLHTTARSLVIGGEQTALTAGCHGPSRGPRRRQTRPSRVGVAGAVAAAGGIPTVSGKMADDDARADAAGASLMRRRAAHRGAPLHRRPDALDPTRAGPGPAARGLRHVQAAVPHRPDALVGPAVQRRTEPLLLHPARPTGGSTSARRCCSCSRQARSQRLRCTPACPPSPPRSTTRGCSITGCSSRYTGLTVSASPLELSMTSQGRTRRSAITYLVWDSAGGAFVVPAAAGRGLGAMMATLTTFAAIGSSRPGS